MRWHREHAPRPIAPHALAWPRAAQCGARAPTDDIVGDAKPSAYRSARGITPARYAFNRQHPGRLRNSIAELHESRSLQVEAYRVDWPGSVLLDRKPAVIRLDFQAGLVLLTIDVDADDSDDENSNDEVDGVSWHEILGCQR